MTSGNNLTITRQMSISRPRSAGALDEYSSALKRTLVSAGGSMVPMSARVKSKIGSNPSDAVAGLALARLKRARRTFEGGPISEERFRDMQAETYRLKRELAEKEQQHRMLVGKLNRAEDAAKRRLHASVDNISLLPKQKLSTLAALKQNYNTEQKVKELEERLEGCQRDSRKYLQYTRRYKAESDCLKKRLEAMVRASRTARSCSSQDTAKHYEKMVKDLQKQLSSISEENKHMNHCLRNMRDQSAATPECSGLSTEKLNLPVELPRVCADEAVPPFLQSKGNMARHEDGTFRHGHVVDHIEDIERCGMNVPISRNVLQPQQPSSMGTLLKGSSVQQLVGDTLSTPDGTTQLMKTWESLKNLTIRYNKAMDELRSLKINHERCLQKLQDTYHELSQERRDCIKLQATEKRLTTELVAAKHTEALLQQVRQQNVQLEIENAELVASALNVPRTNFSELKTLRQQLVEELKQRKVAEAKAIAVTTQLEDCKQELAWLAVVEPNWEYLKAEFTTAKKTITRSNQKVKELEDPNRRLPKQMNMKGTISSQMKVEEDLCSLQGALAEEEIKGYNTTRWCLSTCPKIVFDPLELWTNTVTEIHVNEEKTKELESRPGSHSLVLDNHEDLQDEENEIARTAETGLQPLRQIGSFETNGCFSERSVTLKISEKDAVTLGKAIPESLSNHITLTIISLELNIYRDLFFIDNIYVRFKFLSDFYEPDEQCTPSASNDQAVLHYSYSQAFFVDETTHADVYEALRKMLHSEATAYIQFQIFGEGMQERPAKLLGSCQVDLWAAMYQNRTTDSLETKLEVISGSSKPTGIGKLHILVEGLHILRDIHGLSMPSTDI